VPDPAPDPAPGTDDTPDAAPTDTAISVTAREQNRWESGACFDGFVENRTAGDAAWIAEIDVEGVLTSAWNVTSTTLPSGLVRFEPSESWNQTIAAGTSATLFGYCTAF
jgi:cellulase/cellobiase CelA1